MPVDTINGGGILQSAQAIGVDADGLVLSMNGARYVSFSWFTDLTAAADYIGQQGVETAMRFVRARWDQAAAILRFEGSNDNIRWVTLASSAAVVGGASITCQAHVAHRN